MTDWTSGYVADVAYTFGYYTELNPLRLRLAFLYAGLAWPEIGTACELGFGQGLSVNLHAAATAVQWHGNDFNPGQALMARDMAAVSKSGAQLTDESFAEFCSRSDLPDFDYIGLHGIWSWISDENRHVIVDFIRRKLKVGGIVYVSYNTMAGWTSMAPLRHLMSRHGGAGVEGTASRVDAALAFIEQLLKVSPAYVRANPLILERFGKIKAQSRNYLAHEYFNRDWLPMDFATMADWLAPAKLSYACSAHLQDHIAHINLSAEQQALLRDLPDLVFRESTRDVVINQQFRRDCWVKGARKLNSFEQTDALRAVRIVQVLPRSEVKLTVLGALGEAAMHDSVYQPLLDVLEGHQVHSLGELEQAVAAKGLTHAQVVQAIVILVGLGYVALVQEDTKISAVAERCHTLNKYLALKARAGNDIAFLASPATGGGHSVGRFAQLFLLAMADGGKQASDYADYAWNVLVGQAQKIVLEGKVLDTVEENRAELNRQATEFADKYLPILRALHIAQGFSS